jgi:precorrin-2 dehydrogenase/sirohydrochlorin ferrochelatase
VTEVDEAGEAGSATHAGRDAVAGYPVSLVLTGRRCVVVGGGRIAARKVAGLLDGGADVVVVAPAPCERVRTWAAEGALTLHERPFVAADLEGAWLAFTATGDPAVDRAVADAAAPARVWLATADDPTIGTFTSVSALRRGDLLVAVSTGGRSPALAAWLRRRLDEEMGPEYARLLDIMSEARERLRAEGRPTEDADWQTALDSGMLDLIRAGRVDEAEELLRACLWSSSG